MWFLYRPKKDLEPFVKPVPNKTKLTKHETFKPVPLIECNKLWNRVFKTTEGFDIQICSDLYRKKRTLSKFK